jgi:hypothetical protein
MKRFNLAVLVLFAAALWAAAQSGVGGGGQSNVSGGGTGGPAIVSSLTLPCTNGTAVSLTTGAVGLYVCVNGVWVFSGNDGGNYISAVAYSVQPGLQAFDCTFTSGSPNVSCTNTTFTSAMIGWLVHGTNGCCGSTNQIGSIYEFPLNAGAENTIIGCSPSCPSKTAILSSNASNTVNPGATNGSILTFGPDMTTAITTMTTAVWNTPTTFPDCPVIILPGPVVLTKSGQFNSATCKMPVQGNNDTQGSVQGWNGFAAQLAPTQDFNFATCTGGGSPASCFFGIQGIRLFNVGINGGGASLTGGNHAFTIVNLTNDSSMQGFVCSGWGASDTSLIGVQISNGAQPIILTQLDGCGITGLNVTDTSPAIVSNSFVGDNAGTNLKVATTGFLMSSGNGYATVGSAASKFHLDISGVLHSTGDAISSVGSSTGNVLLTTETATAKVTVENMHQFCGAGNSQGVAAITSSVLRISGSTLCGAGASEPVALSGATIFDGGRNTYSGGAGTTASLAPACTFTSGGGTSPSCATQAGSTNEKGVIIATTGSGSPGTTGTITLTFAGTYAGALGLTPACTYNVDNSGTAWGNEAGTQVSTQSTTAPIVAWFNLASGTLTALATASPYRIDYNCTAR